MDNEFSLYSYTYKLGKRAGSV